MTKFNVDILFERESFNGYSYVDHIKYDIEAKTMVSAENKAKKAFKKDYKGFCIRRIITKEIQ